MTDVYEPREDSLLLEKYVRRFASGNVLDMGTGSGIQARAAAEKATSVIAVDINPDAIDECRKEDCKRISFVRSDLFSAFEGQPATARVSVPVAAPRVAAMPALRKSRRDTSL